MGCEFSEMSGCGPPHLLVLSFDNNTEGVHAGDRKPDESTPVRVLMVAVHSNAKVSSNALVRPTDVPIGLPEQLLRSNCDQAGATLSMAMV